MGCLTCNGARWICEAHPDRPWPHDDCAGPGDPCPDCNRSEPPALSPGFASIVNVNGIDLSRFVERVTIPAGTFTHLGQKTSITISGVFDDGRETCITCQQRFTPGPEGTAVVTETISGRRLGPICPACGTALVAPDA